MSNSEPNNISFSAFISQNNLSPAEFDKQLRASLRKTFPKPSWKKAPAEPGGAGARGGAPGPCAILDTSTPKLGHQPEPGSRRRRTFTRVFRRMYSRSLLGLRLPGRYYFITFTSTPTSPPLKKTWDALRKWLHRYRPGMCWIYCFTDEGHGVIHMVVRLGKGEKRLDARTVRKYWEQLTGARQIKIKHVPDSKKEDLANYLVNQKSKKRLGREFAYQSSITRWRWSAGWIPKGFTKEFGKLWVEWMNAPGCYRDAVIGQAIAIAHEREKKEACS